MSGHVHVVDHETGAGPDHHGVLVITEVCCCGAELRTYTDAVA